MPIEVIRSGSVSSRLYINKLAAAERQLDASIKMWFLNLDELAIHTVAAAAWQLFYDLLKGKHRAPESIAVEYGILKSAWEVAHEAEDEATRRFVRSYEDAFRDLIEFFRLNRSLGPTDIRIRIPSDVVQQLAENRAARNFLKHADRDSRTLLDTATINNEDLIIKAISLSFSLGLNLTEYREVFFSTMYALGKLSGDGHNLDNLWLVPIFKQLSRAELMASVRVNLGIAIEGDADTHESIDWATVRMNALPNSSEPR